MTEATALEAEAAELVRMRGPRSRDERKVSLLTLCGLALVVGVMTGLGAVAFRALIALVHNATYNGTLSFVYDANIAEAPSRFGNWIFFSPVIGGLIVVYIVKHFAPEAKGHGVPEVMDAIFYKRGNIRGKVALVKSLASALSIGTGAAVGREGPIIQIGSALGSAFAQVLRLSTWQKITLLSAGAGAGIAATFNTPLGGVMFALEILLPEVSNRTFLPVVVATGAATTIGRVLIGPDPAFVGLRYPVRSGRNVRPAGGDRLRPARHFMRRRRLGLHSPAGRHGRRLSETAGQRLHAEHPGHGGDRPDDGRADPSVRPFLYRRRRLFGVIQSILDQKMTAVGLLALLFLLKMLATTISLGCGASGGIFSPSLYLGATLGAAFAAAMGSVLPHAGLAVPSAAIVGMAAMVGAGTGGVMTAIVMVFEMTRDYAIIVPVIVAVALAAGVRRALINETIYTIKLRHRGHRIPKERHINLYLVQQAQDIMERRFIVAKAGTTLKEALVAGETPTICARSSSSARDGSSASFRRAPACGCESRTNPDLLVERFVENRMVICRDARSAQHGVRETDAPPLRRGDRLSRRAIVRARATSSASSPSGRSPTP